MYKNIVRFLSFPFTTQNARMSTCEKESRRRLSCTHRAQDTNLRRNLFWFRSKLYWLYNILDVYANYRGHTSRLHSTQFFQPFVLSVRLPQLHQQISKVVFEWISNTSTLTRTTIQGQSEILLLGGGSFLFKEGYRERILSLTDRLGCQMKLTLHKN